MEATDLPEPLNILVNAAKEAGDIAMRYYQSENQVWYKSGNSPVSEADHAVDQYLRDTLTTKWPTYGWLSEETDDDLARLGCEHVIVVDPIDGTRGFISGNPQWCISIAIIKGDRPIHGVLHCPALDQTFMASKGMGLRIENLETMEAPNRTTPLVTGSKKLNEAISNLPGKPFETVPFIPSLAYRLALVAAGHLDGAFSRPGASEWDIAAADLLIEEAGGSLTGKNQNPVLYNQKKVHVPALIAARSGIKEDIHALAQSAGILQ